jgi:hypothetical protein
MAVAGGLLSGVSQGLADDVNELLKQRVADLAFKNQVELLDMNHGYTDDLQSKDQAFRAALTDKSIQAQKDSAAAANQNAVALEKMREDQQMAITKMTEAGANARAQIGQDDVSPVGVPVQAKDGSYYQAWDDGTTTPLADGSGKPIVGPVDAGKVSPLVTEAAKAGVTVNPISGNKSFSQDIADQQYNWMTGRVGGGSPSPAASPAPPPTIAPPTAGPTIPGAPSGATSQPAPQPSPQPGAGAPPGPAAPAAAPKYAEGSLIKQGNATFKIIQGQPVYQGPLQ